MGNKQLTPDQYNSKSQGINQFPAEELTKDDMSKLKELTKY